MSSGSRLAASVVLCLVFGTFGASCANSPHEDDGDVILPVQGHATFGNQCPALGNYQDPAPINLSLYNCPLVQHSMQLLKEPDALIMNADCGKKLITARTADKRLDTLWEALPDNSFAFTVDDGFITIDNGMGVQCSTPVSLTVSGNLDCHDPDRPMIRFEALYYMGKDPVNPRPDNPQTPTPTCQIPNAGDGCYLRATGTIAQCQQG